MPTPNPPHSHQHGGRARLLFAALVLHAGAATAQVPLGTAQTYGVLGASAVTNTGPTVINGDLGVSPGTAISGFPPGLVTGTIHAADAASLQAQTDATTAYNFLAGLPCGTTLTGDLGGRTLLPGVYCFPSSAQLTGTVTLDAGGNPAATFIFQVGSTLTTASASAVVLANGAQACNVWWQMGSSATLGSTTSFRGSLVALASVTLNTGATLVGRAIGRTGAVTLDANTDTAQACAPGGGPGAGGGPVDIPTLSEWGMMILVALLMLAGFAVMRRQGR
jgi:hypothetical protein